MESGDKVDSFFMSSVMNSVPFEEYRRYMLMISTCFDCQVFIHTRNKEVTDDSEIMSQREEETGIASLDYEDGIKIGDIKNKPKVQKCYTQKEIVKLCRPYFKVVSANADGGSLFVWCKQPILPDVKTLSNAIRKEFDLPYREGSLGLADRAIEVFSKRTGLKLV